MVNSDSIRCKSISMYREDIILQESIIDVPDLERTFENINGASKTSIGRINI